MKYNKKELIFIGLIIICSFFSELAEPINNLDEIWQYSFARNIANGKTPYSDFNIIVTPFFSFLGSLFIRIFSDEMVVMRIYTSIVLSLIVVLAYYIFKKLNIDNLACAIYTFLLFILFSNLVIDYNCFILLLCEITILLEIKSIGKPLNIRNEILKSIIVGLSIITKQTMGTLLCIVYVLYKIIYVKDKIEMKEFIKVAVYRATGILVPVIIFIIYLIATNSFSDFINYCILGISEFSNNISYFELFKGVSFLCLLAIIVPANLVYSLVKIQKLSKEESVLTVFSAIMFIGIYPIADETHFIIYAFLGIIQILYKLYYKLLVETLEDNKQRKLLHLCLQVSFGLYVVANLINVESLSKTSSFSKLNHYSYCLISESLEQDICNVDKFIEQKGKDDIAVLILDSSASVYMIPLDKYNKNYDLFMKGNFGKNGETNLISDIKDKEETEILVLNNEMFNWQTPIEVVEYVLNAYEKTGNIGRFNVYTVKN